VSDPVDPIALTKVRRLVFRRVVYEEDFGVRIVLAKRREKGFQARRFVSRRNHDADSF
jgi:hypothetical protein